MLVVEFCQQHPRPIDGEKHARDILCFSILFSLPPVVSENFQHTRVDDFKRLEKRAYKPLYPDR